VRGVGGGAGHFLAAAGASHSRRTSLKHSSRPAASEQDTLRKGTCVIEHTAASGAVPGKHGYRYPYHGTPRTSFDGGTPMRSNASSPSCTPGKGLFADATQGAGGLICERMS
jgi:hypothetical protein